MKSMFFIFGFLLLVGCTKRLNLEKADYFTFGTARGFCRGGDCATFYSIKDGKLYPDNLDRFTEEELQFKDTSLAPEKYLLAKQLLENFPGFLKKNANKTIGCPDCHDQGRVYIELKLKGAKISWHLDPDQSAQPEEIRAWVQKLRDTVNELEK